MKKSVFLACNTHTHTKAAATPAGDRYRAAYDYAAGDADEVSFVEGDIIINVSVIDEGWSNVRSWWTVLYIWTMLFLFT